MSLSKIACIRTMLIALPLGCAQKVAPVAYPSVAALSDDPVRRGQQLDEARATRPETRPRSDRERKAETVAATAAALIGIVFSESSNVILGIGPMFDESSPFRPAQSAKKNQSPTPKPTLHACPGSLVLSSAPCPADESSPAKDAKAKETQTTVAPATETPASKTPTKDAKAKDAKATDAPANKAPATKVPATKVPAE